MRLRRVVATGLLAGALALHASAQTPTFRVGTALAVVDLVVVDGQGRLVTDLRRDEIELREGRQRRPVELLQLVGSPSSTVGTPAGVPPVASTTTASEGTPSSLSPSTTSTQAAERRVVIVVDTLTLSVDAVPRLRDALASALADLPEGVPVMVATVGHDDAVIRQPLTTDRTRLLEAIRALPAQLAPPTDTTSIFDAVDRICAAAISVERVVQAAIEAGELMVREADARSRAASAGIERLIGALERLDGRTHLVLYSAGHSISPVQQAVDAVAAAASGCTQIELLNVRREASEALGILSTPDVATALRRTVAAANRAQVSFYTLDPAGVTTDMIAPSSRGSARTRADAPMVALPGLRRDAGRDYLDALAKDTGGLRVSSNDLSVPLRRAMDDATQYYLVGYTPAVAESDARRARSPQTRTVTISVKRRGVQIRYRRGVIDRAAPSAHTPAPTVPDAENAPPAAGDARPAPDASAGPVPHAAPDPEDAAVRPVLTRAAAWVDTFVAQVANAVLEERLEQALTAAPLMDVTRGRRSFIPGTTTRRRLRSDFLLVRPPNSVFWLSFRDVIDVDGEPLPGREQRLADLFLAADRSALAQAHRIAAAGAAHLLGPRTRTTTSPVFALAFLQPHHRDRFHYRSDSTRDGVLELRFEETASPTLLRTDTGDDLPIRGRFSVDPETGAIHATRIELRTLTERLELDVRFAPDPRLGVLVPSDLLEVHAMRTGASLRTTASYGRPRLFDVQTTEAPR